jgi:hypothetical protein
MTELKRIAKKYEEFKKNIDVVKIIDDGNKKRYEVRLKTKDKYVVIDSKKLVKVNLDNDIFEYFVQNKKLDKNVASNLKDLIKNF